MNSCLSNLKKDNCSKNVKMGVPRLYPWTVRRFRDCVRSVPHDRNANAVQSVDYLHLDSNCIIHQCAQQVFCYGQHKRIFDRRKNMSYEEKEKLVFKLYFDELVYLSKIVRPAKGIYLAIDGCAPLAKQSQQRQRRFISAEETQDGEFNPNSITPGTMFMQRLTQYINFRIRTEIENGPWRDLKVFFSPQNVPGEGEHKILKFIRTLPYETSHCMYGADGDLIMLTLTCNVRQIYLLRDEYMTLHDYNLLDMTKIKNQICDVILHKRDPVMDFIFIGFFVGNDFLPKIRMFLFLEDGLEYMFNCYNSIDGSLVENGEINWKIFSLFLKCLADDEDENLLSQSGRASGEFRNETLESCTTLDGNFDAVKYRKLYYAKDGNGSPHEMCKSYARMLLWTFKYYTSGLPSWTEFYKFHYAPLMHNFAFEISKMVFNNETEIQFKLDRASSPFEQLLTVLPPQSASLLPQRFHPLFENSSELERLGYFERPRLDMEGVTAEYMAVVIQKFVEVELVRRICRNVMGTSFYARNAMGYNRVFQLGSCVKHYKLKDGTIFNSYVQKIQL